MSTSNNQVIHLPYFPEEYISPENILSISGLKEG